MRSRGGRNVHERSRRGQTGKGNPGRWAKGFLCPEGSLFDELSRLDKDLFRLQGQKEKQEEKRDSSVEYMWSEYELTRTAAQELRDDSLVSVPEMKNQIAERKNRIRALGNVNVNAIEDYRELSERYEFMKTQHQDLVTAQEALYQIIEELDTGMRRQFTERFALIRAEFDRVLRSCSAAATALWS